MNVQERGGRGTAAGAAVWLLGALFALGPAPSDDADGERGIRPTHAGASVAASVVLPGPAAPPANPPAAAPTDHRTDGRTDPVVRDPSAVLPPRAPISRVGPTFGPAPLTPVAAGRARWTTSLPPPSVP